MTRAACAVVLALSAGCGSRDSAAPPSSAEIQTIEADSAEAAAKERRGNKKQYQLED